MLYPIIAYLRFRRHAVNEHGIHSPFIYDLVSHCIYDKTPYPDYQNLKAYRQQLLSNAQFVTINDLGSGSRVHNSSKRRVRHIARTSGSTSKKSKLLYRLVQYLKPENSLELGTSLGLGTQALAVGYPEGQVVTIEGAETISQLAQQQLKAFQIDNVSFIVGSFNDVLPKLLPTKFDLVFFDGHHDKDATLNYVHLLLPTVNNETLWIFDDIYWSKEMTEAWNAIQQLEAVTVTVDLFHFGLVFFRKEQAKEHFKVRF